jgi:hypothetical protein
VHRSGGSVETIGKGSVNSCFGGFEVLFKSNISFVPFLDSAFNFIVTFDLVNLSEEFSKLFVFSLCFWERLFGLESHLVSPVMVKHEPPYVTHGVFFQDGFNSDEILERLAHLKAFNVKMASVPEVFHPAVTIVVSFTLSDFIIVVRELKVDTTRVDVHRSFIKDSRGHGRAFNVPPGSAWTPLRRPGRLTSLCFLP